MGKTFNNINELVAYVKSQHKHCTKEIGNDSEKIMKEVTQRNLYDRYDPEYYTRTKDMINKIRVVNTSNESVEIQIEQGGHRSWGKTKRPVYVAPILEEGGFTWEKGGSRKEPTNIIRDSYDEIKRKAPETYIQVMSSKGIKAYRK